MSLQATRYNVRHHRPKRRRQQHRYQAFACRQIKASRRQPPSQDVVMLASSCDALGISCQYEPLRWSVQLRNGQVAGFQADLVFPRLKLVVEISARRRMSAKQTKVDRMNEQQSYYRVVLIRSETAFALAADPERLLDFLYDQAPPECHGHIMKAEERVPLAA